MRGNRAMLRRAVSIALVLLALLGAVAYGVGVGADHWPPYSALAGIRAAVSAPDAPPSNAAENTVDGDAFGRLGESYVFSTSYRVRPLNVPDFRSLDALEAWQKRRRCAFHKRMLFPYQNGVRVARLPAVSREGYVSEECLVTMGGQPAFRYYRLSPTIAAGTARRLPTIVCFMGHGSVLDVLTDRASYQHAFAAAFARAGYIAYVMENIGMGPGGDHHLDLDQAVRLDGFSWYSLLFSHQRVLLSQVFSDSEVDTRHVGAAGVSTGGLLALTAAVQEPRIVAASVQGIFGSMRVAFARVGNHCSCGAIPDLLPLFDLPQLGLVVAPCSLQIVNAEDDAFSPREARRSIREMRAAVRRLDIDPPEFVEPSGGHAFDVPAALAFFDKALR